MMLLSINGLSVFYHQHRALKDISLNVDSGEIVSLLGANASGKTTTLWSILGMTKIHEGTICLEGKDITNLSPKDIVKLGVAIVPENRRLFPKMTVEENLLIVKGVESDEFFKESLNRLKEFFPILADENRLKQFAGTLSGGEQQMVAMARAMLLKPKLLLLDEPSMGMAIRLVKENFRILKKLSKKGIGILLVEQNVKMALSIASRAYVLQEGQIVKHGMAEGLLKSEVIQRSYLGEFIVDM
jgi:branched-chain amino acid transport system ATP-binding protein